MKTRNPPFIHFVLLLLLSTLNSMPRRNAVKAGQRSKMWRFAFLLAN